MPRNIVVCFDGTGNKYGKNNTNVVGTFQSILRHDDQVALYDPGVGTFSILGRRLGRRVGIWLGKGFGYGFKENVEDGYEYLMDNYEPGDKLFIFGFSRGAFTARALVGMLNKVGLLQKGSVNLIPYASDLNFHKGAGEELVEGFKRTYSRECKPKFVGVWDTVASLGHIRGKQFKNNVLNEDVEIGCQAVALHEQRKKFPISLWDETNVPEGSGLSKSGSREFIPMLAAGTKNAGFQIPP